MRALPYTLLRDHPYPLRAAGWITANRDGWRQYCLVQVWLAVVVCVSGFYALHCVFRFLFVLMEDRRCLYGLNRS